MSSCVVVKIEKLYNEELSASEWDSESENEEDPKLKVKNRVRKYPLEFEMKDSRLWCKLCMKFINSVSRKMITHHRKRPTHVEGRISMENLKEEANSETDGEESSQEESQDDMENNQRQIISMDDVSPDDIAEVVFPCEGCDRLFSNQEALDQHVKNQHTNRYAEKKKYACLLCAYTTDYHNNFKKHKVTHTGEKNHKCDICQRTFSQKGDLKTHIKAQHLKTQQYPCAKCDRIFKYKGHLKVHVKTVHDKVRDFVCNHCGKKFGYMNSLNIHVRRYHTNERPFACKYCSDAFVCSQHLSEHVIVKHTHQYPHRCETCNKGFLFANQLKKHMISKHDK